MVEAGIPETRERILVCVSRPGVSEDLIRRGCRIAHRTQGDLIVLHVVTSERGPDSEWLGQVQRLVQDLGGEFQVLEAEDPVKEVLSFAYRQHVTQIGYATLERAGQPHRGRITEAEKRLVRQHLQQINRRLRDQGLRQIDPGDPMMRRRHGLG